MSTQEGAPTTPGPLSADDVKYLLEMGATRAEHMALCQSHELLRSRLAAVSAERDSLKTCNEAMREPMRALRESVNMFAEGESAVVDRVLSRWKSAEAELAAAREALERYGEHEGHCPLSFYWSGKDPRGNECTCGLIAARSGSQP